ncbi:MAG: DUF350 domain-containing protein [Nitrospinota bacterium]|nr:MAG: DUF350 domain-containing protein [Nitrospinota bacterium]
MQRNRVLWLVIGGILFFALISLAGEVAPPEVPAPRQALAISWYNVLVSVIYGLIGIFLLLIGYYIYELVTPFSVKKELLEDQNIALGVVIAAFILGMAIIIASAIL